MLYPQNGDRIVTIDSVTSLPYVYDPNLCYRFCCVPFMQAYQQITTVDIPSVFPGCLWIRVSI